MTSAYSEKVHPRFDSPPGRSLVGPVDDGFPNQEVGMFVEMIPGEIRDIVRPAFEHVPHRGRSVDDASGYKTLNDAVVDLERVCTGILQYVKPENLLLVFGQTIEALRDRLLEPCDLPGFIPSRKNPVFGGYEDVHPNQGSGDKEAAANPSAIVLCKLREAKCLDRIRAAKKDEPCDNRDYCQITWSEFKRLEDCIGDGRGHGDRENETGTPDSKNCAARECVSICNNGGEQP